MKFLTIALIIASTAATAYAGATIDMMSQAVPEVCRSDCQALVDQVGGCLEDLDATLSMCINTSDPNTFGTKGDYNGVRDCACSEEAFVASESCIACANREACLEANPLSVNDMRNMCADPMGTLQDLHMRYGLKSCSQ